MNSIMFMGRMTKDPEIQTTNSGIARCRFTVASPEFLKDANGDTKTVFFNCIAWRTNAENIVKYVKKGDWLGVFGTIADRNFQREDGTSANIWEVNVEKVQFMNVNTENTKTAATPKKSAPPQPELTDYDDDDSLPF